MRIRPLTAVVCTVTLVATTGCGSSERSPAPATGPATETAARPPAATTTTAAPATEPAPTTTAPPDTSTTTTTSPPASKKPALSGVERTVYDNAEGVCEGIGLKEMARQLHVAADALSVATANAKAIQPAYQAAAIDGCRAGLKKHG